MLAHAREYIIHVRYRELHSCIPSERTDQIIIMSLPKPIVLLPASYEKVELPDVKLTHYPVGTETVTPVVIVTLNRPEKYNAFTQSMASSLEQSFKLFHHDDRVKVVVLTGAGKMFCAGSDLEVGFGKRKVANSDYRDMYVVRSQHSLQPAADSMCKAEAGFQLLYIGVKSRLSWPFKARQWELG